MRVYTKGSPIERLLARVEINTTTECWNFTGSLSNGYGQMRVNRRTSLTHRVAHELLIGPIPDGFHVDHLCDNRACCNPDHLEAVTQAENNRRVSERGRHWRSGQTHCKQGHLFDEANTYMRPGGGRKCRLCVNARCREYRARQSA